MPIEVTARHMDAGKAVQEYAEGKAALLMAEFPRVEHVHVILDVEKKRQIANVVVQGKNHVRLEMTERAEHMQAAIDSAMDKMEKKLRRLREKVKDHKPAMKREQAIRVRSAGGTK